MVKYFLRWQTSAGCFSCMTLAIVQDPPKHEFSYCNYFFFLIMYIVIYSILDFVLCFIRFYFNGGI